MDIIMNIPDNRKPQSTGDWQQAFGEQVRRVRFERELDQETLASHANISVGAVKNLEAGRGCTLKTLIRVLRVLEEADWLLTLSPPDDFSPVRMAQNLRLTKPRQRVYKARKDGNV